VKAQALLDPSVLRAPAALEPLPDPSLWQGLYGVWLRDLRLALRRRVDTVSVLVFFVLVASLFPLGVGSDAALLPRLGPGVVWVAALLASMLSLSRLFADDHRDGCLEQMLLSPHPLTLLVLSKVTAHWVASGLLLVLVSPLLALQFGLSPEACGVLVLSLLLGTPILSLLGAIGAALTVGLRNGGVMVSLLVLPLCVPVLVFGAGAVEAHQAGLGMGGHLSLLGALLLLALPTAPWAAAAALRIAYD
jgi:heme exporter protein B